jgi:hypothetical protein
MQSLLKTSPPLSVQWKFGVEKGGGGIFKFARGGVKILDITSEGLEEMFEGDFANTINVDVRTRLVCAGRGRGSTSAVVEILDIIGILIKTAPFRKIVLKKMHETQFVLFRLV